MLSTSFSVNVCACSVSSSQWFYFTIGLEFYFCASWEKLKLLRNECVSTLTLVFSLSLSLALFDYIYICIYGSAGKCVFTKLPRRTPEAKHHQIITIIITSSSRTRSVDVVIFFPYVASAKTVLCGECNCGIAVFYSDVCNNMCMRFKVFEEEGVWVCTTFECVFVFFNFHIATTACVSPQSTLFRPTRRPLRTDILIQSSRFFHQYLYTYIFRVFNCCFAHFHHPTHPSVERGKLRNVEPDRCKEPVALKPQINS